MNRTDYRSRFNKDHYDRLSIYLPKGMKDQIRKAADQNGSSMNDYIIRLLEKDIDEQGKSHLATLHRFGDPEKRILKKWQVAAKYYDMIESISDQDGYYILLKKGFTNDMTGSRTLYAESLHDIRIMITKSHPVRTGKLVDGLDERTVEQLHRWQIPRKYYPMIESISGSRSEGYTITLKEGFINDHSGGREIHVEKSNDYRKIIKFTHEA